MIAYRFADTDEKRPRHRFTLDYQATPNFQPGLEYNAAVEELGFRATWVLQRESKKGPQIHLNTSSDRIGTPKGNQQYSATFSRTIEGTKLAPYFSVTYSEFEDGLVFPFGASYSMQPEWTAMFLNDGRRSHVLATYAQENWFAQIGWIWFERFAVTVGWGF